jgi:MYXO-CTERM domain-containing protein
MAAVMLLRRGLLVVILFVLACSGGGGAPSDGPVDWVLFTNDKAAFDYFVGKGLTNFQAAGIVGNLDQESGVNPNAIQSGGPGRGIAQWSAGGRWDTDSGDNAVAYAQGQGQSVWSLGLQLDFIWYELTHFSGYGLSNLKATTNVTDATVVFQTDFEGCGTCLQSQRIAYAKAVLAAYGAIAYSASFVEQSFPYASTTMQMNQGDVVPSYITLKNTGTKTWDSNTKLGTTMPRDRSSDFADSSWLAPNRLAAVQGTVAPGATYKFQFNLAANKAGTFDEHFGVVQEGVTWFTDPPDDQLEVKIDVKPSSNPPPPPDAGTKPDAGHDAGGTTIGDNEDTTVQGGGGGCSTSGTKPSGSLAFGALALFGIVLVARRKRSS